MKVSDRLAMLSQDLAGEGTTSQLTLLLAGLNGSSAVRLMPLSLLLSPRLPLVLSFVGLCIKHPPQGAGRPLRKWTGRRQGPEGQCRQGGGHLVCLTKEVTPSPLSQLRPRPQGRDSHRGMSSRR